MIKRSSFILINCTTNTVPNFYFIDNKEIYKLSYLKMCMISRHQCQGIRQDRVVG